MKTRLFLLIAGAVSLTLAACSKDNGQVVDDGQIHLSTANIISETRTTNQEVQLTQFLPNEYVDIFLVEDVDGTPTLDGDNVTKYSQPLGFMTQSDGGLSNPQYWPTSGNGLYIYGVYPQKTAAEAYNATNVKFTVKSDQSGNRDYQGSDLMTGVPASNPVARTKEVVPLTFTHLLTKIDINLTAGKGFTAGFQSATVYILNTKPSTTFSVDKKEIGEASDNVTEIAACKNKKSVNAPINCSAIIVPQTVDAGTAFIKIVESGGEYIYKLGATTDFKQSYVYTYNIEVNKTGLTVTLKITNWETAGDATGGIATLE